MTTKEKKLVTALVVLTIVLGTIFGIQGILEFQGEKSRQIQRLQNQIQTFLQTKDKVNYPQRAIELEKKVKTLEASLWKKEEITSLKFADMISNWLRSSGVSIVSFTQVKETPITSVYSYTLDATPLQWFTFLKKAQESPKAVFFPSLSLKMNEQGILKIVVEVGYVLFS